MKEATATAALKLALEALESDYVFEWPAMQRPERVKKKRFEAVTAIKEALAQDEQSSSQEPVAYFDWLPEGATAYLPDRPDSCINRSAGKGSAEMNERDKELALQAGDYVNKVYTPPVRSKTPGKIWEDGHVGWHAQFNAKFADLIRADEREACAKVCDEHADDPVYCGAAIRARGNT